MRTRTHMTALLSVLLIMMACSSTIPQSLVPPGGQDPGRVLLSAYTQEPARPWSRPFDLEFNASFRTIEGAAYYRIGPDDILEMTYYLAQGATSSRLQVGPDGSIHLPGVLQGTRMNVGGLAIRQAETVIGDLLAQILQQPQITLSVVGYRSSWVTVLGAGVNAAASSEGSRGMRVPLRGRTRLSDLVMGELAVSGTGDLTSVLVTDAEGRTGMFDLTASIYRSRPDQDPILDRGDVITIPSIAQTQSRIYVLGEVNDPAILEPRPGLRLMDAIVASGGPNDRANQKWVTLVRGRGESAEAFRVEYREILGGNARWNLPLEPGDIVYVGRSGYNTASQFFRDVWSVLQSAVLVSVLVGGR